MLSSTPPVPSLRPSRVGRPSHDPQLAANARQLHLYLTGETTCVVCSTVIVAGGRRCPNPRCGACASCGAFSCRAGYVPCEEAIEARFQRYVARVAPLVLVVRMTGVAS